MRCKSIVLVLLLVVSMFSVGGSAELGDDNGLAVFLVYPNEVYFIGATVNLEVHTLYEGEYYPAYVTVTAGLETVILSDIGTGMHEGSFIITEEMTDSKGRVPIGAEAKLNVSSEEEASDGWIIYPKGGNPFDLFLSLDRNEDRAFQPGDEVTIRAETRYDGDTVVPDENFYVRVYPPKGLSESIEMFGFGGRYDGTFTIPEDLSTAGTFTVGVSAQHSVLVSSYPEREYWVYKDTAYDYFQVEFFDVWVHLKDVKTTSSSLDLYIYDKEGVPLEDANVSYEWEYTNDDNEELTYTGSGMTDQSGVLAVTLDHGDLGQGFGQFQVTGEVVHEGRTQEFDGQIWPRDNHSPGSDIEEGMWTVCLTEQPVEEDKTTTIEQQVTFDGAPLADELIYYYFINAGGVFGHGNTTTDGSGRFTATVEVPQADRDESSRYHLFSYIQFEADDGEWRHNSYFIDIGPQPSYVDYYQYTGPPITLDVSTFSTGDVVNVNMDYPIADGVREEATLLWGVGATPDWKTLKDQEWESWNPGSSNDMRTTPMIWDNGSYKASFICPEFLTPGTSIYVYGLIYLYDPPSPITIHAKVVTATLGSVNPRPMVTIDNLVEGKAYAGIEKVKGTASDDGTVQFVEVRVDDREWVRVTGTNDWSWEFITQNYGYGSGNHTVYVRSFDGKKYSDVINVTVVLDQSADDDDGKGSPGFGAATIIIGMTVVALALGRRRRSTGQ